MNATIYGIVDLLFKDTQSTEETRALREELLNNCLEHYNDLVSRGLSETEALDAVVESLKGMKEVIDEYPKKPGAENPAEPEAPREAAAPEPEPIPDPEPEKDRVYEARDIRRIETSLREMDLTVRPSGDGRIHIRCETPEQILCDVSGSVLRIRYAGRKLSKSPAEDLKLDKSNLTLTGLLNLVGQALNSMTSVVISSGEPVVLELPDQLFEEMNLNALSGDISVEDCAAARISAHSTSGDVRVETRKDQRAERITAGTASGDITVRGNAGTVELSSMSGDASAKGQYISAALKSTSGDAELDGCAREVRVSSVSGDVSVRLDNFDIQTVDTASTSGDIEIDLPTAVQASRVTMSSVSGDTRCGIPQSMNGQGAAIAARTVSGDIRISRR